MFFHRMTQILKALQQFTIHRRLAVDGQACRNLPAWCIAGSLRLLAMGQHTHQRLQMPLRLHVATHHTKTHARFAVLRQETRDDGLERPLSALHHIRVIGVQREAMAAVLQADAGTWHNDATAKTHVVGLDQTDHHAGLVGGGEVDRATLGRSAMAEMGCALRVDQFCATGQVGITQQILRRHRGHGADVRHPAVSVCKSQLHGFDLQMLRQHAVDGQPGQIHLVEHAQRHQRGDALPVGRNLVHGVARVVFLDRCHPLRLVGCQIGLGHAAAIGH